MSIPPLLSRCHGVSYLANGLHCGKKLWAIMEHWQIAYTAKQTKDSQNPEHLYQVKGAYASAAGMPEAARSLAAPTPGMWSHFSHTAVHPMPTGRMAPLIIAVRTCLAIAGDTDGVPTH